jgi:hypothetical protein
MRHKVICRPAFDRETLKAFVAEVFRIAREWPPVKPESARRTLSGLLPHFDGDPVALGARLFPEVEMTDSGHLFIPPVEPHQGIRFVLDRARDPVPLAELETRLREAFGRHARVPDAVHLPQVLRELDFRVEGDRVIPGRSLSVVAQPPKAGDDLGVLLGSTRSHETVVRDMLRDAAGSRGFRMLVTPPERHAEIGPSVARALGGMWILVRGRVLSAERGALCRTCEPRGRRAVRRAARRLDRGS